jgi:nucleotide-binding universal stress UspA family protein
MIRKILMPTDFSDASIAALQMARDLARRFGASVTLFHVHQVPSYLYPDGMMPVPSTVLQDLERSIVAELLRLAEQLRGEGVQVDTRHVIGSPVQEICRAADELEMDLIVMGTHGRTGLRHVIMGSVAEKVVRRAPCAVLTVHPSGEAAHVQP